MDQQVSSYLIQVWAFCLSMGYLIMLRLGRLLSPRSGNSEAYQHKPLRNIKGLKSFIHLDGRKVCNSMKDSMMMPKEVTILTAVLMLQL